MKNILWSLALGIATMSVAGAKEPKLTGLALQQIQSRDMEATSDTVFKSVMTVLQDSGFRIMSADKDTGLITAQGSSESKIIYNIWFGFGSKKQIPIVSAFVEERGINLTRVRLNFVMSTGKSRNAFTDEKPVEDSQVYKDAFERIEKEIFTRQAMLSAPPPNPSPPVQQTPSAVPVGSTTALAPTP